MDGESRDASASKALTNLTDSGLSFDKYHQTLILTDIELDEHITEEKQDDIGSVRQSKFKSNPLNKIQPF